MTKPRGASQRKTVLDCALTMLGRKPYSRQELSTALGKKGYASQEVEETLTRLLDWGYLDDRLYAETRIEKFLAAGRSRLFIKHKLIAAGVPQKICEVELDRLYSPEKERELIYNLWRGFHTKINGRKPMSKERVKWARKLLAAGFPKEEVQVCFEQEVDS